MMRTFYFDDRCVRYDFVLVGCIMIIDFKDSCCRIFVCVL